MRVLARRTYVLVAVGVAIGTAIAEGVVFVFWGVLETIGRFDAPADMSPATRALQIGIAVGVGAVLVSRVWQKEKRTTLSATLLGVGAGLLADGALYFSLPN